MKALQERLWAGLIKENPIFVQAIGMCPTLAVTSSATNGFGMGLAVLAVLLCSNAVISLLRRFIPDTVRIPSFIVVIAGFVTVVQFVTEAWTPALNRSLGIFIPLIVVNCIILGRAEAYASKNGLLASIFDAVGMGLGFTLALTTLGGIREILGAGTLFGKVVLPAGAQPALVLSMAPGAFIALGILLALVRVVQLRRKGAVVAAGCGSCDLCGEGCPMAGKEADA
ncbi:MAG: electron transport complex subunit E [Synergistales bacterium]|nr:electron transport complex subunit E [Synergistales bacterium]